MAKRIAAAGAILALLLGAPLLAACDREAAPPPAADAETAGGLARALRDLDAPALARWSGRPDATPAEIALAGAALASLGRSEEDAAARLAAAAGDPALTPDLHRYALLMLFSVRFRQGRYAEALDAIDAALALGADPDPARAASDLQGRGFAAALADAPPMQAGALAPGALPVERDMLGLPRAAVTVNGLPQTAVLDTGASFSAVMESRVAPLGLRLLGTTAEGRANAVAAVDFRLAVADTLTIGGMEFRNVVFTVVPDSALTFGGGAYRIEAIVGLPVLMELGRLEFRTGAAGQTLAWGPSPFAPGPDSNLLLNGTRPMALVDAAGAGGPLQMMLDTGSNTTNLTDRAASDHPALVAGAQARTVTVGGLGGTQRETVRVIPDLTLSVRGFEVPLRDVWVRSAEIGGRHGIIGHDVLGAGGGYALDFQAMRFELLP